MRKRSATAGQGRSPLAGRLRRAAKGSDLVRWHSWISKGTSSYGLTTRGPPPATGSRDDLSSFLQGPHRFVPPGQSVPSRQHAALEGMTFCFATTAM